MGKPWHSCTSAMMCRISVGKMLVGKDESENDSPSSTALSSRTSGTIADSTIIHQPLNDLGLCRTLARIAARCSSAEKVGARVWLLRPDSTHARSSSR